jgi:glutamate decarboxylase
MTMGCGRRADALKLALGWIYYGKRGYQERIDHAFEMAEYFAIGMENRKGFHLVSNNPPPCRQMLLLYR